jgi:probable F420-dependent oxidoreductase
VSLSVFVSSSFMPEEEVLALAPTVERLGYDGITLSDHLFMPHTEPGSYPYSADGNPPFPLDSPWPDGIVLMAALAAVTTRIRFLNSVLILPLRNPIVVAKAVATAARLSGGRVMLGIGVGWQREEFDAVGVDFTRRGAIANEMIDALRTLWQKGPVEHHGRFFDFGPLLMEPVPPRIPIVVGGASDAALRRAARLGDGFLLPITPLEKVPGEVARLRAALAAAGRDESEFETIVPVMGASAEEIKPILDLGVQSIGVSPWAAYGRGPTSVEQKVDLLEHYAEETLSVLREVTVG